MNIVLDTNVIVAALISHGQCNDLLEHCATHHTLVTSKPMLDELQDVLIRKCKSSKTESVQSVRLIRSKAIVVEPAPLAHPACRDPDDDMVLGTALSGGCVCIVTGDKDLTVLDPYQGIHILTPGNFWAFEAEKSADVDT